ncbi:MAG: hypothetical protein DRN71_03050 [Candidatus Nanohalarchaeota archaeon]|nr:MAG: hypothetical protein DRN71_03050 [Candidatus Nanohaloarchaeota archaeon]
MLDKTLEKIIHRVLEQINTQTQNKLLCARAKRDTLEDQPFRRLRNTLNSQPFTRLRTNPKHKGRYCI